MKRGDQIAYVPLHAYGDLRHPDVEFGFITSVKGNAAFCRYWWKGAPGSLRTKSCNELTNLDQLVLVESVNQGTVNQLLKGLP